jgi:hypothetical protein
MNHLIAAAARLGFPSDGILLLVDVMHQQLFVHSQKQSYPVSTAVNGLGEQLNSHCTPRGFHRIVERYGSGLPAGAAMTSRQFTGDIVPPSLWQECTGDKILSRILRLSGCLPGMNAGGAVDSYDRFIYLHGTNQEQYVGIEPSSHGCIRMKNHDIIRLFDNITDRETWCWIG